MTTETINLDIGGSSLEVDIDVGKSLSKDIAYQVLREKGGLSDKVPTYWSMPLMKMLQFETNPSCYTGPKQFPFVWDGAECSFAAPFTIRVHNLSLEEARPILQSIKNEYLKHWVPPAQKPATLTKIYVSTLVNKVNEEYQWKEYCSRPARSLDTVHLDNSVKKRLVQSVQEFQKSEALYDKHGITWKKIFLLYGPPGTGKTSTILALAGYFQKDIARISITPTMTSFSVENLLSKLGNGMFVILEDVDSLFVEREAKTLLDFSTLLNILDGVLTKRGLVLFMTTNHLMKLDCALKRPGRIDELVEFLPPTREIWLKALGDLAEKWPHEHEQ